jgi:uridine kinase
MKVDRVRLLKTLAITIVRKKIFNRATIVAIDGVDCSGKSQLSSELAEILVGHSKTVVIHEDDFLHPRPIREKQGKWSYKGFYEDFFDFNKMYTEIIGPLYSGDEIDFEFSPILIRNEQDVIGEKRRYKINNQDIVIVEGLFLLRPELMRLFDFVIRLNIPNQEVIKRALSRDVGVFGNAEYVLRGYNLQSLPAQDYYIKLCQPNKKADIVIENSDINNPIIKGDLVNV